MRKNSKLADNPGPEPLPAHLSSTLQAGNDDTADNGVRLNQILQEALVAGSTEIHVEQDGPLCRIRKRVNEQLDETRIESASLAGDLIKEMLSKSKTPSIKHNLAISDHGAVSIVLQIDAADYQFECTYYPTACGHNLSIQVVAESNLPETLEQTRLDASQIKTLRTLLTKKSQGLTLIFGSCTDLLQDIYYGSLGETNCVENKIVSLEHTNRKAIPRINQLALKGLDSCDNITRLATQYADEIFIDWQSAKNKTLIKSLLDNYQSATLFMQAHNPGSVISQLTDTALNERQLATNLSTLIHTENVRTICPHCANTHDLSGEDMQWLEGEQLGKKNKSVFVYAPGCERCDYSGAETSVVLMSVCTIDDNVRSAIETRSNTVIDKAIHQSLGESAISQQLMTLVSQGKVSFTEYKKR